MNILKVLISIHYLGTDGLSKKTLLWKAVDGQNDFESNGESLNQRGKGIDGVMSEENDNDGSAGKGACNVRVSVSESADDLWWPIEVACHDWATGDHHMAVGFVAGDEPKQRQTGDSGPKRRAQAIEVPARERGRPRCYRPTTSWGGIAGTSTASRGAAWPAVLFLAKGIADLGEASPRSAVRHSDERGLANGHGCVEHHVSAHALRWMGWPFPAWSIASPMRVDHSVVAPMPSSAGITRASYIGKQSA
ncbi:uncharacterized protein LOC119176097 isoform X4 [Rhipicephalus microplus]|uniref:uncharacterized protein LOC119176097 isoform X4 n=1 Tax=Rhipicephalus microplus TaxID=6941 RepID=UPI003F6D8E64